MDDNPRFERLIKRLQDWRDEDEEDNIELSRDEIVVLLEGIAVIQADDPEDEQD